MLDWGNLLNAQRAINNTQSMLNAQPPQESPNLLNVQRAQRATPLLQPLQDIWGKLEKWGLVNSPNAPFEVLNRPDATMRDKLNAMSNMMFVGNMQNVGKPVAALLGEAAQGIKAYHGSPHDFDKFDLSKIGTGEGAQAYGHGLYFAENEGVAKSYRDTLAKGFEVDGANPEWSPENRALEFVHPKYKASGDMAAGIQDAITRLKDQAEFYRKQYGPGDNLYDSAVTTLSSLDPTKIKPAGKMYEVNIKADPSTFLDYDKPLSQQPKARDALVALADKRGGTGAAPIDVGTYIGSLRDRYGWPGYSPEEISSALKDAGVPGIKYLDQGSRASGEGSRNYVVFDPSLIEILRKYGILAPMAGGLGFSNGDNRQ